MLANEVLALQLTRDALVDVCAIIEGHPDNVAPALHGGAVLGVLRTGTSHVSYKIAPLTVHTSLAFVFAVPAFMTATKQARAVLPTSLPYSQAVLAVARAAALVQGLATGDAELLALALDDVLHVPYRRALIDGYDTVTGAACVAGAYGATLSGSGSTLVAIGPVDAAERVRLAMHAAWMERGVNCDTFVTSRLPVAGAT